MRVRFDLALILSVPVLAWAAIDAFGILHGCGVVAAVYMLMPYRPPRTP